MQKAIGAARKSIQLKTYIYTDGQLGRQFLETLLATDRYGCNRVSLRHQPLAVLALPPPAGTVKWNRLLVHFAVGRPAAKSRSSAKVFPR